MNTQTHGFKISCIVIVLIPLCMSCESTSSERFTLLSSDLTGIDFVNELKPTKDLNIFNYLYFYDGAGVAAGDLNGDSLPDLFFTANQKQNRLYLNRGDLKFDDVTDIAIGTDVDDWSTGVTFADVNNDGKLDIYVSNVGEYMNIRGRNKLFINQGNNEKNIPVFEEKAKEYGLDLVGFSTQAVFFDYDLDNDLDMYMMNHSVHSNNTFDYSSIRNESHSLAGDKLLRNEGGKYVDVTKESGIYSSALGYGLGIGIADLNQDGYPDIYIGNDFHEDDYLYLNNGDGTFTESLEKMIQHTSRSSMGNDMIDINNDGLMDIFSLDMQPEDYEMAKASAGEDPYRIYHSKLRYGYKHQFSRNTLQLNRGDGKFSEIGLLSGVHATDWSWAALGADFDHNGYADLFISNGIKGRTNDLDYISFISDDKIQQRLAGEMTIEELKLTEHMPAVKIPNYMYRNDGSLFFKNVADEWGLAQPSYSSGAVYSDLDGDGDLDIALNNVDQEAFIYRNNTMEQQAKARYLTIRFNGPDGNRFGVGARVEVPLANDEVIVRELYPVRGFQSSLDYTVHVGLDSLKIIPKLYIRWPDGKKEVRANVETNQLLSINYEDATDSVERQSGASSHPLLNEITKKLDISYRHEENDFVEFTREALIPHMVSKEGPALAVGDVNGDRLDDFYVGGAKRQEASLYLQLPDGSLEKKEVTAFKNDFIHEDVDASFVDIDSDEDLDLVVVSGGNEYYGKSEYMMPRLYINDGNGNFQRDEDKMPHIYSTGSVVAAGDIDNNGTPDLFIGSRAVPWKYGVSPVSYLLINNYGSLEIDSTGFGKKFSDLGMVTDAQWADMNSDGTPDLVVTSEWSNLKIIYNTADGGEVYEIPNSSGLWNTLELGDLDGDGHIDIIAGNLGLNSKFKASEEMPLNMYVNDFDENGTTGQILTYFDNEGDERLFATKDELGEQLPYINKEYKTYWSFARASLTDVVDNSLLSSSVKYAVNELKSCIFYNRGNNEFEKQPLPVTAQFAPIHDILLYDFNRDALPDVLTAGNYFEANIQRGRYDADYGNIFINEGEGVLKYLPNSRINWFLEGQVRQLKVLQVGEKSVLVTAENNKPLKFFEINPYQHSGIYTARKK